jgi:hypothetical protein
MTDKPAAAAPGFEQTEAKKLKEIATGFFSTSDPDAVAAKFSAELDVIRKGHGDMNKVAQYAQQSNSELSSLPDFYLDPAGEIGAEYGPTFRIKESNAEFFESPLKSLYLNYSSDDGLMATAVVMPDRKVTSSYNRVDTDPYSGTDEGIDSYLFDYGASATNGTFVNVHTNLDGSPATVSATN